GRAKTKGQQSSTQIFSTGRPPLHKDWPAPTPTKTLAEGRPFWGSGLSLQRKAKSSGSAQANPLRPTRRTLWRTIQTQSLTAFHPQHSAERGDKDRCDEKQPRQQPCAPLSHERLTPNLPLNHSNISECGFAVQTLCGLVRNAEVRWSQTRCARRANPVACRTIGTDFRRR